MMKKSFFILCLLLLAALGFCLGKYYRQAEKSVVLRVSTAEDKIDYDLLAAMNYMQYVFKQNGYKVYETKYPGNFYSNEADDATVNVFVRGYRPFLDTRLKEDAFNIYFMHRFTEIHNVEFQGFDYYLSSQFSLLDFYKDRKDMGYFESGAVPHEILKPNYQYDLLFIYEYYNEEYEKAVEKIAQVKLYGGMAFARLSKKERQEELAKAKVVVYVSGFYAGDDTNYIPYAIYDIISYGRPLATNLRESLVQKFGDKIYLFESADDLKEILERTIAESDNAREKKAKEVREKMLHTQEVSKLDFIK